MNVTKFDKSNKNMGTWRLSLGGATLVCTKANMISTSKEEYDLTTLVRVPLPPLGPWNISTFLPCSHEQAAFRSCRWREARTSS